ncbi:MAG: end-binding protein Ku [Thermoplasmata archaeon]|jgi:DNA end-binding protein Ku|nr:end-binding protein Ku [Thermoplasmata archaeon]
MARAVWSGAISLGLVNIPVKLVTAVTDKDVRFHMLHAADGARIKFKRVCAKHGDEVPGEEIVKGYEYTRGSHVTFTEKELAAADPEATRSIELQEFVASEQIDPVYYEKPYYLLPDKNAGAAYQLLRAALDKSGRVGIGRMVMHDKEHLVAIRVQGDILMLETMRFQEEVVPPEGIAAEARQAGKSHVDAKQLKLAEQLIAGLSAEFDPQKYRNEHRDKLMALIEQKAKGHDIVAEPTPESAAPAIDLVTALEKSLKKVRGKAKAAA